MVWVGNVGDEGLEFVSCCSGGNDDVVGGAIRAVGSDEGRIPGVSLPSKL